MTDLSLRYPNSNAIKYKRKKIMKTKTLIEPNPGARPSGRFDSRNQAKEPAWHALASVRTVKRRERRAPAGGFSKTLILGFVSSFFILHSSFTHAGPTTIDAANHFAYGANIGWMDWRGDTANGAVIGEFVCSGNIYSANVGWISLGSGSPTNGIYYQNVSAGDFGVNQDGLGNLRGYAWGANIGWINFESTGAPKVDLYTGNLSGSVWSANCGWISLTNAAAFVQTVTIRPGALAPDGLPAAWLLQNFGTTNVDANADPDHDGASNAQEYLAGTNPNDGNDFLRITAITRGSPPSTYTTLVWPGKMTRYYGVQQRATLNPSDTWFEFFTSTWPGATSVGFNQTANQQFYRVRAFRPLMP